MKQRAAPTGLSIMLVTGFILLLTLAMYIGAMYVSSLIWAAVFLTIIVIVCYLFAPVAYELDDEKLVVISRVKRKTFSTVVKCTSIEHDKPLLGIRIWGNGGLFAGTGIYWNKKYGIFRAYVTTGKRRYLVLVETVNNKVIISPEKPEKFLS